MKDWAVYLAYPRPDTVPIERAIQLAELDFNRAADNCMMNGGCDGDYSGQMQGVDALQKEVKRLKKLKRQKAKEVCTHCGGAQ
jgi:hypothetical protein